MAHWVVPQLVPDVSEEPLMSPKFQKSCPELVQKENPFSPEIFMVQLYHGPISG